eukprot:402001-Amphidinium_carterae.1
MAWRHLGLLACLPALWQRTPSLTCVLPSSSQSTMVNSVELVKFYLAPMHANEDSTNVRPTTTFTSSCSSSSSIPWQQRGVDVTTSMVVVAEMLWVLSTFPVCRMCFSLTSALILWVCQFIVESARIISRCLRQCMVELAFLCRRSLPRATYGCCSRRAAMRFRRTMLSGQALQYDGEDEVETISPVRDQGPSSSPGSSSSFGSSILTLSEIQRRRALRAGGEVKRQQQQFFKAPHGQLQELSSVSRAAVLYISAGVAVFSGVLVYVVDALVGLLVFAHVYLVDEFSVDFALMLFPFLAVLVLRGAWLSIRSSMSTRSAESRPQLRSPSMRGLAARRCGLRRFRAVRRKHIRVVYNPQASGHCMWASVAYLINRTTKLRGITSVKLRQMVKAEYVKMINGSMQERKMVEDLARRYTATRYQCPHEDWMTMRFVESTGDDRWGSTDDLMVVQSFLQAKGICFQPPVYDCEQRVVLEQGCDGSTSWPSSNLYLAYANKHFFVITKRGSAQ